MGHRRRRAAVARRLTRLRRGVTLALMPDDTARTKAAKAVVVEEDALIGQTLNDRFEVIAAIARGGMGRVYRAIQRPLGRQVALKVLDVRGVVASRGDFQRRFFLEAATAAKLTHPNTIVVFDYGLAGNDVYFIAMELVEGNTLAQTFKAQGPLDPLRVVHIGRQICGSLGEAHTLGVVHRDLKPSNVLLAHRGSDTDFVKVLDFGLVKVLGDEEPGTELTQSGVMMGTPRYMSPEQVTGSEVTGKSDIYALGAVLYHALSGRPPFDGESKFEIFSAHVSLPPTPLREMYPLYAAPARLEALVMRCLAKDPRKRFATMEEVDRELAACAREIRANPLAYATGSTATTMDRPLPRATPAPPSPEASFERMAAPQQPSSPGSVLVASESDAPAPLASAPTQPSGAHAQPSGVYAQPSGAHRYEASGSGASVTGSQAVFQLPREGGSPVKSGLASFLGVAIALSLVALGAAGYYALTRSDVAETPEHTPGPPPADARGTGPAGALGAGLPGAGLPGAGLPGAGLPGAGLPGQPGGPLSTGVRLLCDVPGARLARGGVDLGDCGVSLPVPPGDSWEIQITAPGHVARRVVIFAGQGDVPITLARRGSGSGPRQGGGGTPATPRRGGDVRNPWN